MGGLTGFLKRHSLVIGLILIFVLTWPIDLGLAAKMRGMLPIHIPLPVAIFVGYGIVAAALIMTGLTLGKQGLRDLLRRYLIWRAGILWYVVALLSNAAICLAAIQINILVNGAAIDYSKVMANSLFGEMAGAWYIIPAFFLFSAIANGEEIGWRGYVLPRLQVRYSALISSLILAVIWAAWHIPKFLVAGATNSFLWFLLDVLAKAVLLTWVYNNTKGSLLIVTLYHASFTVAAVFLPIDAVLTGDPRTFAIVVIIELIFAAVVIAIAGAENLSKNATRQVQA